MLADGRANPAPERSLPWSEPALDRANVVDTNQRRPSTIDEFPGDRSPEGVLGLAGNVQEWTESPLLIDGKPSPKWRITRGGNWDDATTASLIDYLSIENPRPVGTRSFASGVRCVEAAP